MESHIRELSATAVPSALVHRSMNYSSATNKDCLSLKLCLIIKLAVRASTRPNRPWVRNT
jgi:hypothetical protein